MKLLDLFLFILEIALFVSSGAFAQSGKLAISIGLFLLAIIVALHLGNRIYQAGKKS